jgi:hypothetical protein
MPSRPLIPRALKSILGLATLGQSSDGVKHTLPPGQQVCKHTLPGTGQSAAVTQEVRISQACGMLHCPMPFSSGWQMQPPPAPHAGAPAHTCGLLQVALRVTVAVTVVVVVVRGVGAVVVMAVMPQQEQALL